MDQFVMTFLHLLKSAGPFIVALRPVVRREMAAGHGNTSHMNVTEVL